MKNLYRKLIVFADGIFLKLLFSTKDKVESDEIVFVRTDMIGDFFSWIPFLISQNFKNISIICTESLSEYISSLNVFNNVYPINIKKFKIIGIYRYRTLYNLRKINPKLVVNTRFSRSIIVDDSIVRIFKNKNIITMGINGDNFNITADDKVISNKWYHELINIPSCVRNELSRNKLVLDKIKNLGVK